MNLNGLSDARKTEAELFSQYVTQKREALSLSKNQLAIKCGAKRTTISMIETGQNGVTLGNAIKILRGVDSSLAEFEKYLNEYNKGYDSWLH